MGRTDFLLRCAFGCNLFPAKLSDFHQLIRLYWQLINKHNFTPSGKTDVCLLEAVVCSVRNGESKIWAVADFRDRNRNLLQHDEFCNCNVLIMIMMEQ